ncbi:hypothetical protein IPJ72_00825 [Candidatus Peregrinibacteria bacterium]|nr:MAG: hypothetical protein IPJ72_00825 [Candidatus Peregrinibacteria bacterium]
MFKKLLLTLLIGLSVIPFAFADRTEQATVIKFNKDDQDIVVERLDGSRWLLQYNRMCRSYTTEFPVNLIINSQEEITQLKIKNGEICRVYYAAPYSGDVQIDTLVRPKGVQRLSEAEVIWQNSRYRIRFGNGCRSIYTFSGKTAFLSLLNSSNLLNGQLILPRYQGRCTIEDARLITTPTDEITSTVLGPLTNLYYVPGNGNVTFYWDALTSERLLTYVVAYSRNPLEPTDFTWEQMPHVDTTKDTHFTFDQLDNGRAYYFYFAPLDYDGQVGEWTQIEATSVADRRIINQPDFDAFEVNIEEYADHYLAYWPSLADVKRFYVRFYVDGHQQYFHILKPDTNEVVIPKNPAYAGKRLRFTVSVKLNDPYARSPFDGVLWMPAKK